MNAENERSPLLHTYGHETWRKSVRKRCLRIPSEITITGIILGLFLVVVTSLLLIENLKSTKENEIDVKENILASPFKYNKKSLDPSWQDKRDSVKTIKARKWDKINKSWKHIPDPSGFLLKSTREESLKPLTDEDVTDDMPDLSDEYGKELDESWEIPLQLGMSKLDSLKDLSEDEAEIKKTLLSSKLKLKEINDGWKTLSEQGWKDKDIRKALFKALKDRKNALDTPDEALQSPMNLNQMWETFNDNWKKNLHKGDKDMEQQKSINDDWKSKFNLLQSPKSKEKKNQKNKYEKKSFDEEINDTDVSGDLNKGQIARIMNLIDSSKAKWKKIDDGWKKLSEQGWKENAIRRALLKALINGNEALNDSSILQSPMKVDELWDEIKGLWTNLTHKGDGETGHQSINDNWKNKMNTLQSSQASYKKWKKERDEWKKLNNKGWKNKDNEDSLIDAENDTENAMQSPMYSPSLWGKLAYLVNSIKKKGSDTTQPKQMSTFQSPTSDKKWKKDHGKGTQSEQNVSNKNVETALLIALKETEKLLLVPADFEKFLDDMIQIIKDLQTNQSNSREDKNENENESLENQANLQFSMPSVYKKWKEGDNDWKKLPDQGLNDKKMRDALEKAWKDGDRITQSSYGSMKWKKVNDGWKKIYNKSVPVPMSTRCPISKAHRELLLGSPMSADEINCALITENARRELGKCIDLSFLPKSCKPSWRTKCFSLYKYRKIDGTCNNKIHPTWGKSGTPYVRMIAPDFADGVSAIRRAKNGEPLPNARFLSKKLYSKRIKPDEDTSVLFLYFGLIVDHDMAATAANSESIPCCDEEFQINPQTRPKECLQIDVPEDDPFYGPRNVKCLNLVRSIPVHGECPGRREQLNKATSYLDGSAVYGSTIQQAKTLRTFSRGQLQTQLINNTPFMGSEGAAFVCGTPEEPLPCFAAGDSRVNMMVELTAMHTVWYREHNRIATELHKLNPHWNDEVLYQEARRILIGELQHIAYNEFLPLLLGEKTIEEYGLKIDESEEYDGYDDTIDASVFNVFAAAAFRFGHSLSPSMQYLLGPDNSTISRIPLHETFFNANLLYHKGLDLLLRGAASQRTHSVDSYVTPEVQDHLFQPANLDYGHDLAAVGIQRGRDHGLPPYTKWRSVCGLSEVKTWADLYSIMDKERADMFKEVYSSVDDIDLIPGALAENHKAGSLVGPTYTCLIGRQFKKTRKGDRFWFEEQKEIGSFTRGQLDQIYKSNVARIICDNSDDIKMIQRQPFKIPSDHNPLLDCSAIPKVDLSEWRA